MKKLLNKINLDWIKTILILLSMWIGCNSFIIGIDIIQEGSVFGETTFFGALKLCLAVEAVAAVALTVVGFALYSLFKSLLKGQK